MMERMDTVIVVVVVLVIIIQAYLVFLEMFIYTSPLGQRVFGNTAQQAQDSKRLAENHGLYNGFLAAGLIWGLAYPSVEIGTQILTFFLFCITVASIYSLVRITRFTSFLQGIPALIGLILIVL